MKLKYLTQLAVPVVCLSIVAVACGSDSVKTAATTTTAAGTTAAPSSTVTVAGPTTTTKAAPTGDTKAATLRAGVAGPLGAHAPVVSHS